LEGIQKKLLASWTTDTDLFFGNHDKTSLPGLDRFALKNLPQALNKCIATTITQAHHQDTSMGPRCKTANIRKIQVLGDQETAGYLGGLPNLLIRAASQLFLQYSINIMS